MPAPLYRYREHQDLSKTYGHISRARTDRISTVDDKIHLNALCKTKQVIDILPPGVLWVNRARSCVLLQEPPQERLISIRHRGQPDCACERWDDEREEYGIVCQICSGDFEDVIEYHHGNAVDWGTYLLPMPWIVYSFSISDQITCLSGVYTSAEEVTSPDQVLSALPLPNVYNHGELCAGNAKTTMRRLAWCTLHHSTTECLQGFWSSAFNYDVQEHTNTRVYETLISRVENINDWSDESFFKIWESLSIDEALRLPWNADGQITLANLQRSLEATTDYDHRGLFRWLSHLSVATRLR